MTSGDPIEIATAVLAAATAEPGEVPADLRDALPDVDADPAGRRLLDDLREAQLLQARQRRRAAELEALFSTARELVRLQNVDEVLQRLVERAHALMGTDVTYLSEYEPDTLQLRVRHSEGTATPEFRDLLVPSGYGLASLVARTREPAWVADYTRMSDAPHDDGIDAAVRAEGLVSFLGVPLAVGDEVLGALFACNRFAHDFSPEQVVLLSAFADHAASVLRSARALADAEQARESTEQAYRELERHLSATELAGAVHEELTSAVISGGTVVDVVATLARRLGGRVLALDARGRPLDTGAAGEDVDLPPTPALTAAIGSSRESGHVAEVRASGRDWLVIAIMGADRVLGAIAAEAADRLPDDVARRTLERAAHVAALVSFQQEAVGAIRAEHRARWLLAMIEDGRASGDDTLIAPPTRLTGCALIDIGARGSGTVLAMAERAVGDDGIVAQLDHRVVIAWTAPEVLAATERVRRVLADALRAPDSFAVAAVRDLVPGELPRMITRLTADLQFLPGLGVTGVTVSSDAFAPYQAVTPHDSQTVDRFIADLIGPVIAWDERRGTELFDTISAYFACGESRAVVAERLHIHVNTVQQRLDRIRSLLADDLDDPEHRFRLQSAVRLEQLRRSIRSSAR